MKILIWTILASLAFPLSFNVNAASEDECAIWLCLPTGFGQGCGGAKSAFKKRIKKFKPPLPPIHECIVENDTQTSDMSYDHGYAAYIPKQSKCLKWIGGANTTKKCQSWKTIPEQYIVGKKCNIWKQGESYPAGCTETVNYVKTFLDGKQYGSDYFW